MISHFNTAFDRASAYKQREGRNQQVITEAVLDQADQTFPSWMTDSLLLLVASALPRSTSLRHYVRSRILIRGCMIIMHKAFGCGSTKMTDS